MDPQFLEFWGNYLLMVAKGQRRMEDAARWINQGVKGFEDLAALFAKLYGLDRNGKTPSPDSDAWDKATAGFSKSLADWIRLMGWVPETDYRALEKKYQVLEGKVAALEETNRYLRSLLNKEGDPHAELVLGFAELVQKQSREFQQLVSGMGKALEADKPKDKRTEKT